MIAKKTYENQDFIRGGHPYDTLKIGKAELRILDKLLPITKKLGLVEVGIEDLNKKKAIASWRLPTMRGYPDGRITFFRNTDKENREFDYGIFIMGKNGTDIQEWKKWDTLEKWKANIGYMYESVSFERGKDAKSAMGVGMSDKYPAYDLFIACHKLALSSENFSEVTDIIAEDSMLFFVIESKYFTRDRNNDRLYEEFVIRLYPEETGLECYDVTNEGINYIGSKKKFMQVTKCSDPDDDLSWLQEGVNFERGKDPKDALNIGKNREIKSGDTMIVKRYQSDKTMEVQAIEDPFYYDGNPNSPPYWEIMVKTPKGKTAYAFKYFGDDFWEIEELFESANFIRGIDPKRALEIGLPPKMGEGYTVLWRDKRNKWSIERYTNPHTKEPNLVIVSDDYIDYPILYNDGRIAYDNPYNLPQLVRDKAHKLYLKIKGFNESVSFERGMDSKEALKIGQWHRKKIERELRKVIEFFNEPWLEEVLPEYIDKLDKLGIEIYSIIPEYRRGSYDYVGKSLVEISWKNSQGKEITDQVQVHKQPDLQKKFGKNEGKNVLYPVLDEIEWHEHSLMR
jgi:hypothetical protein